MDRPKEKISSAIQAAKNVGDLDRPKKKIAAAFKVARNPSDLVAPKWESPSSIVQLKTSLLAWMATLDEKTTDDKEKRLIKFLTEKIERIFKDGNLISGRKVQNNPNQNAHAKEFTESITTLEEEISSADSVSKKNADLLKQINPNDNAYSAELKESIAALEDAMTTAKSISKTNSDLVKAVKEISPTLDWYKKKSLCEGDEDPANLEYSNANIIGERGIIRDDSLTVGLTVMPANTMYPEHRHRAEEFYVVLSSGSWNQKSGPWVQKDLGDYVYNPSNIIHATRTEDKPLVTIWFHYTPPRFMKIQHEAGKLWDHAWGFLNSARK